MGKQKDDEPAGLQAIPESGAAVPAPTGVPAGEPADAVPGDPGQPQADGAGDDPAADPVAALEGDAVAVGTQEAEGLTDGEAGTDDPDFADLTEDYGHFDVAHLARSCAAGARLFAQVRVNGAELVDYDDVFSIEEASVMSDFVRANPDAPLLAMYKHLELVKRLAPTVPNADDMLALTVFHATASAAIAYERALAAEAARPAPTPAGAWPGERSFKPQEPAFTPSGFSPR